MKKKIEIIVPYCDTNYNRLDHILVQMIPDFSRSILKKCIISQQVYVNLLIVDKPNTIVFCGDKITIFIDIKKKKMI